MTDERFEPTPWWDFGDDEKPVPLGVEAWQAPDEAELIVNAEREAIIREDTEPNLVTLAQLAAASEPAPNREGVVVTKPAALAGAALLLLGCLAMFVLGWSHGRETVANARGPGSVSRFPSVEPQGDSLMSLLLVTKHVMKGGEE